MILAHGTFQVQIGSGRTATFRGDALSATDGSGYTGIVSILGSSTVTFDSSSATPLNDGSNNYYPMYSFGGTATQKYRGLDISACAGTCIITSNLGGGHGILFSHHGFTYGAAPQASTGRDAFSHLGSAATPMYEAGLAGWGPASSTSWNMPTYTATDCGPVVIDGGLIWGAGGNNYTFIDGGIYNSSPGESNFKVYNSYTASSGTRAVTNAIYDKGYGFRPDADSNAGGIVGTTFTNSYLATLGSSSITSPGAITTSTILYNGAHNNGMVLQCLNAPLTHGLIYLDFSEKPDAITSIATSSASAIVSDIDIEAPVDPTQGGKPLFIQATPASPTNYTWTRINISPTKTDNAAMSAADFINGHHTNTTSYLEHITMFGAGPNGGTMAIIMDEGGTTLDSPLGSFRSNLIWSTHAASGSYSVLLGEVSPAHDPCGSDGSLCGYNATQSPDLTYSCPQCLNAGNGYYSYFTSPSTTGGQTDAHPNPGLVDTTRRVATWYLDGAKKATPVTWTLSESIGAGDLRASSNAAYYSGKPLAYRALRAHAASTPLRPDGPGFNIADGSLTGVVVSPGMVHVNLSGTPTQSVQLGDWVYVRRSTYASWLGEYQVTGVAADNSWFEGVGGGATTHTYTDASLAVDVWKNWWEPASLYQIRQDISAGRTYTSWAYGCNACAPAQAVQQWKFAGVRPTNGTLRDFTYPGDTNTVTNPGAVQMAPVGIFPLPGGMRRW